MSAGWSSARPQLWAMAGAWLVSTVGALGCGSALPCAVAADCLAGEVCGLEGACAPLEEERRFASSRWSPAIDHLAVHPRTPDDTLWVGGPERGAALLSFGALPAPARILRAVLVLHSLEPGASWLGAGVMRAERVVAYRRGESTQPSPRGLGERVALGVVPGPAPPIRLDVTSFARAAAAEGEPLHLRAWLEDERPAPFAMASPLALAAERRPRLELSVQ